MRSLSGSLFPAGILTQYGSWHYACERHLTVSAYPLQSDHRPFSTTDSFSRIWVAATTVICRSAAFFVAGHACTKSSSEGRLR
jgi:hypothetical protein